MFFFFPLARSSTEFFLFFSSPFRSPSLPAIFFSLPIVSSFLWQWNYLSCYSENSPFPPYNPLHCFWFSPISWTRNSRQPWPRVLLPTHPARLSSFVWLHQSAIDVWHNKEEQAFMLTKTLRPNVRTSVDSARESPQRLWFSSSSKQSIHPLWKLSDFPLCSPPAVSCLNIEG